jgi:8-oxo-dGTP pyrophosphatase MutT (NUDIX family)
MKIRTYRVAGGVVLDAAGPALLIEYWVLRGATPRFEVRLPKGHVEPGETDAETALREVCEETGYCGLAIVADLGELLNEFDLEDEHVCRTEHYFLMRLTDSRRSEMQSVNPDEARFQMRWAADLAEAEMLLTYESERHFVCRSQAYALESRQNVPL